jgi:hypothetical protein
VEFIVPEQNQVLSSTNGVLFNKDKTTLVRFPLGKSDSYSIPNSVSSIGYCAFYGIKITSITIPNSVTTIGNDAFRFSGLLSVIIGNSVTSIGYSAFSNTPLSEIRSKIQIPPIISSNCFSDGTKSNGKLYVPLGSSGIYRDRAGWKEFKNIIEE